MYFNSGLKKRDSSVSETVENVTSFVFISSLVICIYVQSFLGTVRKQAQTISTRANQKKIKSS